MANDATAAQETGIPCGGDFGEPRVVVPAPAAARHAHVAWPKIVKAPGGALVVACSAGRSHTRGGCPAVSVSRDGGRSFSPPHVLAEFDDATAYRHCGNLALGVAEDGAVCLLAMAHTGDERNSIFGWRSADSGETWQPVDTAALADNQTGSVYGHVFNVPGAGLAVCGHYRKPKGDGVWISFSRDDGWSWAPPRTITAAAMHEPAFIYSAGRLVGLVRENAAEGYWQLVSDERGATWLPPELVLHKAGVVHPSPFLTADPRNADRVWAFDSQRSYRAEGVRRGAIHLWMADVADLAWRRVGLVATFAGIEDYAYPWMTHLHDRTWFVVFYAGAVNGPNAIYGMEMDLSLP